MAIFDSVQMSHEKSTFPLDCYCGNFPNLYFDSAHIMEKGWVKWVLGGGGRCSFPLYPNSGKFLYISELDDKID